MFVWQPIETAPTNKSRSGEAERPVLVWDGQWITVAHGTWYADRLVWMVHNSYGFNEDGQIYDITHWMPLPDPPETSR